MVGCSDFKRPEKTVDGLIELPYWFKVTYFPKNLGILAIRGEKHNF